MPTKTKKSKQVSGYDAFMALSDVEKERVWESFNREIPLSETSPLTAADRRLHEKARRRGRPRTGEGAEPVTLTIERGLLRRTDAFAARTGLTRSQLVAMALTQLLSSDAVVTEKAGTETAPTSNRRRKAG
jgi:hypothetical protein